MNQDIIYEILANVRTNGDEVFARILLISLKSNDKLEKRLEKTERPIAFSFYGYDIKFRSYMDKDSLIYLDDKVGSIYYGGTYTDRLFSRDFDMKDLYRIRIYGHKSRFIMPINLHDVYSIGKMTDLTLTFSGLKDFNKNILLDTSNVTSMIGMFCKCENLTKNIGKYWNTAKVVDMTEMFTDCPRLNKNIGKNWDVSNVMCMDFMFGRCSSLDKNIGQNWNTKNLRSAFAMFYTCQNLNQNIGQYWNTSQLVDMTDMFASCKKLDQNIGENWDTTKVRSMEGMFDGCTNLSKKPGGKWNLTQVDTDDNMFTGCKFAEN